MNKEVWRPVKGFPDYKVSNSGNVSSNTRIVEGRSGSKYIRQGKAMSLTKNTSGYLVVKLCRNGKPLQAKVHRLVAEAFIENPLLLPLINHRNGIKIDNKVDNLEWCTPKDNIIHAYQTGLCAGRPGASNSMAKLCIEQVRWIRTLREDGLTPTQIARSMQLPRSTVNNIFYDTRWADVP